MPNPIPPDLRAPDRVFAAIYHRNGWDGTESVSGPGSTEAATASVRARLPAVLADLGATSLLDIPCGDAHWIGSCLPAQVRYTGASLTFNLAGILGASVAPLIATSLAKSHGLGAVGYYLTGVSLLSLVALIFTRSDKSA